MDVESNRQSGTISRQISWLTVSLPDQGRRLGSGAGTCALVMAGKVSKFVRPHDGPHNQLDALSESVLQSCLDEAVSRSLGILNARESAMCGKA